MKIIRDPRQTAPCVLVLGMFDGVHRGHQMLLMQGVELAERYGLPLNVCTFEPHPLSVLRPGKAPARLTTQTERAQLMAGFGVDSLCVMHFTRRMADQAPEDFMAQMTAVFSPRFVVCGFNFTFGQRGRGTGESLKDFGASHRFETVIVPEVILEGATVSSTRIRALLAAGQVREASRLLGHAYTLATHAAGPGPLPRAHRLAIPRDKALPAFGLYACYLTLGSQSYPAVVRIGEDGMTLQPLDSCLRLADHRLRLTFMHYLGADMTADTLNAARAFFFSVE